MSTDEQMAEDLAALAAADAAAANPFTVVKPSLVARGRELARALESNPGDPHMVELAGARAEQTRSAEVRRTDDARRFRELRAENPFAAAQFAERRGFADHLFTPDDEPPEAA